MMRKTLCSVPVLCSLLFVAACDDIATVQRQSMGEQTQSNTQVINEKSVSVSVASADQGEAADKTQAAEVDAGFDTQAAQSDKAPKPATASESFGKARKEFVQTMQSRLVELDRSIAALEAKTQRAAGQKHVDKYARLKKARAQREALVSSIKALETELAETWDASRARIERQWTQLKALLDSR